jgi:hypothetical protein
VSKIETHIDSLNELESVFRACDRAAPFNFTVFGVIDGPLTLNALQTAAALQIERFPRLGYTIDDEATGGAVWVRATQPIKIDIKSGGQFQVHLSQTLNTPFGSPQEHLFRLCWYRTETEQFLLLTLNHVLGDGRSGLRLFQQIIGDAARVIRGEPIRPVEAEVGVQLTSAMDPVKGQFSPSNARQFSASIIKDRSTAVLPISLDQQLTSAIAGRCRRLGVSLTGLIAACHGLALVDALGSAGPISLSFPVDWRGRSIDGATDAFGLAVGNAQLLYRLSENTDVWALARRIGGDLKRAAVKAPPKSTTLDPASIYEHRSTGAVSSVGRIHWDGEEEPLHVSRVGFAVGCSYFGDHILTAATFAGSLQLTYCVVGGTIALSQAKVIAEKTVGALEALGRV